MANQRVELKINGSHEIMVIVSNLLPPPVLSKFNVRDFGKSP